MRIAHVSNSYKIRLHGMFLVSPAWISVTKHLQPPLLSQAPMLEVEFRAQTLNIDV